MPRAASGSGSERHRCAFTVRRCGRTRLGIEPTSPCLTSHPKRRISASSHRYRYPGLADLAATLWPSSHSHQTTGRGAPARSASASDPYTRGFMSRVDKKFSDSNSSSSKMPCHPIAETKVRTLSRNPWGGSIVSEKATDPASGGHVRQ